MFCFYSAIDVSKFRLLNNAKLLIYFILLYAISRVNFENSNYNFNEHECTWWFLKVSNETKFHDRDVILIKNKAHMTCANREIQFECSSNYEINEKTKQDNLILLIFQVSWSIFCYFLTNLRRYFSYFFIICMHVKLPEDIKNEIIC